MGILPLLTWLHLVGLMVWVGSIVAVGVILTAPGDAEQRGRMARRLYLRLATPGFGLALLAGMLRLLHPEQGLHYYFAQTKFMHAKLLFAVALIAIHHVLGARAKKLATARTTSAGSAGWLAAAALACAVLAAYFPVFRPF